MSSWSRPSTTPERMKIALAYAKMKQIELSRLTGIDRGTISNYASGKYEPKSDAINKMAIALNVNEMWLWGYDVPMEREKKTPDKSNLTEGEELWLKLYHQLTNETREVFTNMVTSFDSLPADKREFLLGAIRIALESQK